MFEDIDNDSSEQIHLGKLVLKSTEYRPKVAFFNLHQHNHLKMIIVP